MRRTIPLGLAVAGVLALSACGSDGEQGGAAARSSDSSSTSESSPSRSSTSSSAPRSTATTSAPSTTAAPAALGFGDSTSFPDGIDVTLSELRPFTPAATARVPNPAATPLAFDVTVTNNGTVPFDNTYSETLPVTGSTEEERIYDEEQTVRAVPRVVLQPGGQVTWTVVYGVTTPEDFSVSYTPHFIDVEPAVFSN